MGLCISLSYTMDSHQITSTITGKDYIVRLKIKAMMDLTALDNYSIVVQSILKAGTLKLYSALL